MALTREGSMGLLSFVAQDRQANGCLHTNSFAGRKDMEHEVRNVCVQNRVGVSLDCGMTPSPGTIGGQAVGHLRAIANSFFLEYSDIWG